MNKHRKGWQRAKEMKKWRHRKGGLKEKPHAHLQTALGEALNDWLSDQRRSGLRPASVDGRRIHIRLFLKWCWDRQVTRPEWISRGLIEGWVTGLDEHLTREGAPYANTSKESMIRSVNAFLVYLLAHRRIDCNPLAGTRLRRCNGLSIPLVLDEAQVLHLLEMPATDDVLGLLA